MSEGEKIIPINIEEEMKTAYIDYSMSVIVSRALPDVRDGLKPVHRRVLYGMLDLGVASNKPHKKSARIVGEVLGKYHPHGDGSVYDAMVRMAQDWSLRYPLVDGQGNYGSMDGDSPAAMRYTEARLRKIAEELLSDIEKDTVDFTLNFDDSLEEPTVLPAKVPNLLINGASGIAVGMATNMPPHNLTEVIDGTIAYIDNKDIPIEDLIKIVKAPDFPTSGIIYGYSGVKEALMTGRGKIVLRARATIETTASGKDRIIVTEVPFQVNKAEMIKRTADLINEKKIDGITDIRDESNRDGIRVVYELRRDAVSNVVLNNLYKYTALQSSFSVNNVALVNGRPMLLNLKDMIVHFVNHRHEVVIRRTKYDLAEAEKRAHILEGLLIALDHLDEVIKLIRASQTPPIAQEGLMTTFGLSEIQSKAILEMRLQRLTGLERDKIRDEYNELMKLIEYYRSIYGIPEGNKTSKGRAIQNLISLSPDDKVKAFINIKDLENEEYINNNFIVMCTKNGTIKKTSLEAYSRPRMSGINAITIEDDDVLLEARLTNGKNEIMLATKKGKLVRFKEQTVRPMGRNSIGVKGVTLDGPDDVVIGMVCVTDPEKESLMVVSEKGYGKRSEVEEYRITNRGGKGVKTINITEKTGNLIAVKVVDDSDDLMIINKSGVTIRMSIGELRIMGRATQGVRLIRLDDDDEIASVAKVEIDEEEKKAAMELAAGTEPVTGTIEESSDQSESPSEPESDEPTPDQL
ncbi:MAG: DNA gyrase subunit A [Bacteroidetes bacterium]|nr:DNA gyrase subunit A [Bacteroidota bacterium]